MLRAVPMRKTQVDMVDGTWWTGHDGRSDGGDRGALADSATVVQLRVGYRADHARQRGAANASSCPQLIKCLVYP
jgi:hypothetical protein